MRRVMLSGIAVLAGGGPALAQHWIPPRPGQSVCSGWDTAAARDVCQAKEDDATAAENAARSAEKARTQAIIDAGTAKLNASIAADRARAAAAASEAAQRATTWAEEDRQRYTGSAASEAAEERALGGVSAKGFKLRFAAFGAGHFLRPGFAGPPPLQSRDCEDPEPDRSYICHYSIGSVVYLDAETDVGSDRLGSISVTWDGSDRRQDLFAETAGFVVGALSSDTTDDTWRQISQTICGALPPRPPFPLLHLEWRVGFWLYRYSHEGRYGSRDTLTFTATRVSS